MMGSLQSLRRSPVSRSKKGRALNITYKERNPVNNLNEFGRKSFPELQINSLPNLPLISALKNLKQKTQLGHAHILRVLTQQNGGIINVQLL